jgi:hypothetical protein
MIAAGLLHLQSKQSSSSRRGRAMRSAGRRGPSVRCCFSSMYWVNVNPVEIARSDIGLLPNSLEKDQVSSARISASFSAEKHSRRGRNVVRLSCILDRYHTTNVAGTGELGFSAFLPVYSGGVASRNNTRTVLTAEHNDPISFRSPDQLTGRGGRNSGNHSLTRPHLDRSAIPGSRF